MLSVNLEPQNATNQNSKWRSRNRQKTALYALRFLLLEHQRRRHGRHTCRRRLARAREPTLDTRCRGGRVRQGGLVKCGVSGTGQDEQADQYTRDGKDGGTVASVEHEPEHERWQTGQGQRVNQSVVVALGGLTAA